MVKRPRTQFPSSFPLHLDLTGWVRDGWRPWGPWKILRCQEMETEPANAQDTSTEKGLAEVGIIPRDLLSIPVGRNSADQDLEIFDTINVRAVYLSAIGSLNPRIKLLYSKEHDDPLLQLLEAYLRAKFVIVYRSVVLPESSDPMFIKRDIEEYIFYDISEKTQ